MGVTSIGLRQVPHYEALIRGRIVGFPRSATEPHCAAGPVGAASLRRHLCTNWPWSWQACVCVMRSSTMGSHYHDLVGNAVDAWDADARVTENGHLGVHGTDTELYSDAHVFRCSSQITT